MPGRGAACAPLGAGVALISPFLTSLAPLAARSALAGLRLRARGASRRLGVGRAQGLGNRSELRAVLSGSDSGALRSGVGRAACGGSLLRSVASLVRRGSHVQRRNRFEAGARSKLATRTRSWRVPQGAHRTPATPRTDPASTSQSVASMCRVRMRAGQSFAASCPPPTPKQRTRIGSVRKARSSERSPGGTPEKAGPG